ncbi:MAG: 4Fe-4S dicluster domain-containing protein [Bacillota bacterium]
MNLPGYKNLPKGGLILEPGTAGKYETGDWRSQRPVFNPENCINCMFCWINCPDASIIIKDGKVAGVDYKHCKGCGICAYECPAKKKAFEMKDETEFDQE